MWSFESDAWQLLWRTVIVYGALLLMMRLSGRRTVGQFTPFDLLVVMLLSEAAGPSMTGSDQSLSAGLMVCAVLILLNTLVGFLTAYVRPAERLLEGEAILLGRNGRVFDAKRKRHRVSKNDIEKALRENGCALCDMEWLFLEADGSLSVVTHD